MKQPKHILTLIFICLAAGIQAQLTIPKKAYWHLAGTTGSGTTISMNMVKINDSLYADCCFTLRGKQPPASIQEAGKPYDFCGKMDAKGNFLLHPFSEEFPCFRGQLLNAGSFTGELEESKAGRSHFELAEIYKAGSVQFSVFYIQQNISLVKKPKSPAGSFRMAVLSPNESGNHMISDSLRRIMLKAFNNSGYEGTEPDSVLAGDLRVFSRDYILANQDLYKQMPAAGSLNWELLRFMHIVNNDSYILSFYILNYAFTGGAHGLESLEYSNVDLKTGQLMKLDDVIPETRKQDLSRLLTGKLKRMNNLPDSQKLSDKGYFVNEIQPNENFYLTRDGIGFLFNHYDIAPYSFGATDIFLTADEVRDLLKPGFSGF